jgi:hypothetical protein
VFLEENIYALEGCQNREGYLRNLAEDYDIPHEVVVSFADMLGPSEDFDGLINTIEDYQIQELRRAYAHMYTD